MYVADQQHVGLHGVSDVRDMRVSRRVLERPFGSDDYAVELSERRTDLFTDAVAEGVDARLLTDVDEGSHRDATSDDADARCGRAKPREERASGWKPRIRLLLQRARQDATDAR